MDTPPRILLADANVADIKLYEEFLSDLDCEIQTITNGPDVLDCVRRFHPRLILLNPSFPDIDGFQISKQIRDNPSTRQAIILMVTPLNDLGDIERAVESGTNDFVSKPIKKFELRKRVENLLQDPRE